MYPLGFVENPLPDGRGICQNLFVGQAQNGVAQGAQVDVAILIVSFLVRQPVDAAVDLHDELQLETTKVRDEDRDRELAAEFQAVKAPIA